METVTVISSTDKINLPGHTLDFWGEGICCHKTAILQTDGIKTSTGPCKQEEYFLPLIFTKISMPKTAGNSANALI